MSRETTNNCVRLTITVGELAAELSISRAKAYAMVRSGELPSLRVGRVIRVPTAGLRAWLTARTAGGTR